MEETFVNQCRACAGFQNSSTEMMSLFENNVFKMFTLCTSLEVDFNDCLPNHVCCGCYGHLSNFSKFREKCLDADILMREQIDTKLVKAEPLEELLKPEENEDVFLRPEGNEMNCDFTDFESSVSKTEYVVEDFSKNEPQDSTFVSKNLIPTSDTTGIETFICDYCGQHFDKKSYLGSHMVKHKNEFVGRDRPTNFPCDVQGCNKMFKVKKSLICHKLKVHEIDTEPSEPQLCCHKCPKRFTNQHILDGHIRAKHEGLKPYKCSHCAKEFTKRHRYLHHLQTRHNEDVPIKKFHCPYDGCDKEYNFNDSLNIHIKRVHFGIIRPPRNQKLICDQCGGLFKDGFSLRMHSYSHSGTLPFACKICPKRFLMNHELQRHTMRHLKIRKFVCTVCGAKKTTAAELRAHLNFHSKEITYPCKECDRVFPSSGAIGRHVRIHHRNHKPYICPHCQRAFAKAEVLKNHVMTHTGEKPFSCSQCGHRFIQSVALRTHMKVHAKK